MKRWANLCILLVMASAVIIAQTAKPASTSVTKPTVGPAVGNRRAKMDEMREYKLQVFREHVLARTLDSIKKIDEAGLRVSARNHILTYLAIEKLPSDEKQALATQIARDALTDLQKHNEEITPFMLNYLSNDLVSWIQKHRPNLLEEFEKTINAVPRVDASFRISSLFRLEGGDILAAKQIRRELEQHGSLSGLNFWLDELMIRKSKEFEPVASDVIARAREGQISFETLFWISDVYLRPQTPSNLRNRFLATVVARTQPANFVAEPPPKFAYDLLTQILPVIKQSTPELYEQALNHSFAMRASLNESQLASEARIKRLNESIDPIGDLKSEAESAKTKTERNELLLGAAELALEKKKFDVCLNILGDVDVSVAAADPFVLQYSIDRILKILIRAGLTAKLTDVAEKGAARIGSSLTRVEALTLIMRYYTKANDKEAAQRILIEASKVAGSSSDNWDKAKAFFLLSVTCDQVDGSKKADLLLSGVKALNNVSESDMNARDKTIYQSFAQRLDNVGYDLSRGFKSLTKHDENDALALVEKLQKPGLRTFALIGILTGLDGLLTEQVTK